jgi:FMN-dependent oxidoreductase (nitrilotriacetate monooxygenase family)
MAIKPFHLGLFAGFKTPWSEDRTRPWSRAEAEAWADGSYHCWMAEQVEAAGFDFLLLEDALMIGDAFGGTYRLDLQYGCNAPRHDGMLLLPLLGKATRHIGLLATMSTTFTPPYLLARMMATVDHMTHGRSGWNLVTSSQNRSAQNFGIELPAHDLRYDMAEEFLQVVNGLWDTWDADARVLDEEHDIYVDHRKVRRLDFEGRFYKCRGPITTLRPPQGRPVLCQAGQSPKGIEFAGRHAELVVANQRGPERMKTAREKTRAIAMAAGRNPDHCKVLYIVSPIIADTTEQALELRNRLNVPTDGRIEMALGWMGGVTEIDFSQFDFDAPLPKQLKTEGHQGVLAEFLRAADGRTLREVAGGWNFDAVDFVGTADSVADQMIEVMQEVGGDGYLLSGPQNREVVSILAEKLAPALRKRGAIRDGFRHQHFRDNLLDF